jgi:hypothetical protein
MKNLVVLFLLSVPLVEAKGGAGAGRATGNAANTYSGRGAYAATGTNRYMMYGIGGGAVYGGGYYGATRHNRYYGDQRQSNEKTVHPDRPPAQQAKPWRYIRIDLLDSGATCPGLSDCAPGFDWTNVPDVRFVSSSGKVITAVGVADSDGNPWAAGAAKNLTDGKMDTFCTICNGAVAIFDLGAEVQIATYSVGVPGTTTNQGCLAECTSPTISIQYNVTVSSAAPAFSPSRAWPVLQEPHSALVVAQQASPQLLVEYLTDDFSAFGICPSGYKTNTSASTLKNVQMLFSNKSSTCSGSNLGACMFIGPGGTMCTAKPAKCSIPPSTGNSLLDAVSNCEVCRDVGARTHEYDECLSCKIGYHLQQEWEDCTGKCVEDVAPSRRAVTNPTLDKRPTLIQCSEICTASGLDCIGFQWFPAKSCDTCKACAEGYIAEGCSLETYSRASECESCNECIDMLVVGGLIQSRSGTECTLYTGTRKGSCWTFPNNGGQPETVRTCSESEILGCPQHETGGIQCGGCVHPHFYETGDSLFCLTPGLAECTVTQLCPGRRRLDGGTDGWSPEISYDEFVHLYSVDEYGRAQPTAIVASEDERHLHEIPHEIPHRKGERRLTAQSCATQDVLSMCPVSFVSQVPEEGGGVSVLVGISILFFVFLGTAVCCRFGNGCPWHDRIKRTEDAKSTVQQSAQQRVRQFEQEFGVTTAPPAAMPVAVTVPQPQAVQVQVIVPPGHSAGQQFAVAAPGGGHVAVTVPHGVSAGQTILVNVPAAAPVAVAPTGANAGSLFAHKSTNSSVVV